MDDAVTLTFTLKVRIPSMRTLEETQDFAEEVKGAIEALTFDSEITEHAHFGEVKVRCDL